MKKKLSSPRRTPAAARTLPPSSASRAAGAAPEPSVMGDRWSMDHILASIRRILDGEDTAAERASRAA